MSKAAVVTTDLDLFLRSVSASAERILIIDYDGTIAPFSADRGRAYPYPSIPRLLCELALHCKTRVIMISGRRAHDVANLLQMNPAPEIWGTHGVERLYPDGRYECAQIGSDTVCTLEEARTLLECQGLEKRIESLPGAIAVHWRGLDPSEMLEVRTKVYRVFTPFATRGGLQIAEFDGGVELR